MFFLKVHPSCESDPMVWHWWIALGKQCDLVSLPPFCCLSSPTLFKSSFRDLQSDKTGPDRFCCAQKLKRARKKENHSQTSGALENRFYSEKCIQRHTLPTHVKRTIKKKKSHCPSKSLLEIYFQDHWESVWKCKLWARKLRTLHVGLIYTKDL